MQEANSSIVYTNVRTIAMTSYTNSPVSRALNSVHAVFLLLANGRTKSLLIHRYVLLPVYVDACPSMINDAWLLNSAAPLQPSGFPPQPQPPLAACTKSHPVRVRWATTVRLFFPPAEELLSSTAGRGGRSENRYNSACAGQKRSSAGCIPGSLPGGLLMPLRSLRDLEGYFAHRT